MSIRDTDYIPIESIPLKSPIAIGGFFIHFLQQRFKEGQHPLYAWKEDILDTDIVIASGYTITNEIRNTRPALYVTMGQLQSDPIVLGDRASNILNVVKEFSYHRVNTSVTINVESNNRGESYNLGWFVFSSLLAAQDVIREKYMIYNLGPFSMNPPMPSNKDATSWVSQISAGISYELTSAVEPVQTFIRELDLTLQLVDNDTSVPGFFTKIYLNKRS
jgi:hypothetical protein